MMDMGDLLGIDHIAFSLNHGSISTRRFAGSLGSSLIGDLGDRILQIILTIVLVAGLPVMRCGRDTRGSLDQRTKAKGLGGDSSNDRQSRNHGSSSEAFHEFTGVVRISPPDLFTIRPLSQDLLP